MPEGLEKRARVSGAVQRVLDRDGRVQFGTLGRGNHFLELQRAEDSLWLTVHSGSRALGQAVLAHYVASADLDGMVPGLLGDGDLGRRYLADTNFALDYAKAGRLDMLERASGVLGGLLGTRPNCGAFIDCHHNFVEREDHFGELFWVHRKGALLADEGRPAIIPGSMGDETFHVSGRGCAAALRSSSHGAGRRMSRAQAKRRISASELGRELQGVFYDHRLRDEATSIDSLVSAREPCPSRETARMVGNAHENSGRDG